MAAEPMHEAPRDRFFSLLVFAWERTDNLEDALTERLLVLLRRGLVSMVVADSDIDSLAGQLHIKGKSLPKGRFYATANRGSEVYGFDERGHPELLHVGLTDQGGSMAWVTSSLAPILGIPPEEILVIGADRIPDFRMMPLGPTFLSVGPARLRELLSEVRFVEGGLPSLFIPTMDEAWQLRESGFHPGFEQEIESLFAIANGFSGCRGAFMVNGEASRPAAFFAGVFDPGADGIPELVVAPDWREVRFEVLGETLSLEEGQILSLERVLDLRQGMLFCIWRHRSPKGRVTRIHEARFLSLADRHAMQQCLAILPENYEGAIRVTAWLDGKVRNLGGEHLQAVMEDSGMLVMKTRRSEILLVLAAGGSPCETTVTSGRIAQSYAVEAKTGEASVIHRCLAAYTSRESGDPAQSALAHAFPSMEALETAHSLAWRERWKESDIEIGGDEAAQRAVRFALYHLIAASNPEDPRVSVGARALTGEGYRGHVFWDTEIYMLPFYVHSHPPAARALLQYRYHTLSAAKARAHSMGYRGALYAWESADTGEDVTPRELIGPLGQRIPILTGKMAHHVSSAVAYGVWYYWIATGDDGFLLEAGAEIFLEIARFWSSRAERDSEGFWHIRHVIGPDEYHVDVDDNAYTNWMARWVLETGGRLVSWLKEHHADAWERLGFDDREVAEWSEIAQRMVTGLDEETRIIEQFRGYFQLEAVDYSASRSHSMPIELLIDPKALVRTQTVKQADVVMLLHLLWERFSPEERRKNFHYYDLRTVHGSSLCPGAYGLLAAKLGEMKTAMHYFRFASMIDLDNRMGNAQNGVHAASLGTLWQFLFNGFGGIRIGGEGITFEPHLPENWKSLSFSFFYRSWRLRISIEPWFAEIDIEGKEPLSICLGEDCRVLPPGRHRAIRRGEDWIWSDS